MELLRVSDHEFCIFITPAQEPPGEVTGSLSLLRGKSVEFLSSVGTASTSVKYWTESKMEERKKAGYAAVREEGR